MSSQAVSLLVGYAVGAFVTLSVYVAWDAYRERRALRRQIAHDLALQMQELRERLS